MSPKPETPQQQFPHHPRHDHDLDLIHALKPKVNAALFRERLSEGGDISALIDRVRAGHSSEWNGHNVVGKRAEDASFASEALESCEAQ